MKKLMLLLLVLLSLAGCSAPVDGRLAHLPRQQLCRAGGLAAGIL